MSGRIVPSGDSQDIPVFDDFEVPADNKSFEQLDEKLIAPLDNLGLGPRDEAERVSPCESVGTSARLGTHASRGARRETHHANRVLECMMRFCTEVPQQEEMREDQQGHYAGSGARYDVATGELEFVEVEAGPPLLAPPFRPPPQAAPPQGNQSSCCAIL